MKLHLPLLLVAGLVLAAQSPAGDAAKDDLKMLQGTWKVEAVSVGGKDVPPAKAGMEGLVIKGEQVTIRFGGKDVKSMKFKIDPTKKPKALDLRITRGEESVDWKCIYAVKGDELKICMPLARKKGDNTAGAKDTNERPDTFDTKDRPLMLITAKREANKE
jgi:uncharacterized protein (TIGR03067 family)